MNQNPYSPPQAQPGAHLDSSGNGRFSWRTRVVCGMVLVMSPFVIISGILKVPSSKLLAASIVQAVVVLQLTFVTVAGRFAGQEQIKQKMF